MTGVLVKKEKFGYGDRHPQREDNMKTQGQGRKHSRPPEAQREARNRLSLTAHRRSVTCRNLDLGCVASGTVRQSIPVA